MILQKQEKLWRRCVCSKNSLKNFHFGIVMKTVVQLCSYCELDTENLFLLHFTTQPNMHIDQFQEQRKQLPPSNVQPKIERNSVVMV